MINNDTFSIVLCDVTKPYYQCRLALYMFVSLAGNVGMAIAYLIYREQKPATE